MSDWTDDQPDDAVVAAIGLRDSDARFRQLPLYRQLSLIARVADMLSPYQLGQFVKQNPSVYNRLPAEAQAKLPRELRKTGTKPPESESVEEKLSRLVQAVTRRPSRFLELHMSDRVAIFPRLSAAHKVRLLNYLPHDHQDVWRQLILGS